MIEKWNLEDAKTCPVCRDEYSFPVAVSVICGTRLYKITHSGCEEIDYSGHPERGVIIVLEYLCESKEHRWREIEQFHKGITYEETQIVNRFSGPSKIIWRD